MYKFIFSIEENPYIGLNQTTHIASILSGSQWGDIAVSAITTWQNIKELGTDLNPITADITYRSSEPKLAKLIDELMFYEALIYENPNRRIVYGNL